MFNGRCCMWALSNQSDLHIRFGTCRCFDTHPYYRTRLVVLIHSSIVVDFIQVLYICLHYRLNHCTRLTHAWFTISVKNLKRPVSQHVSLTPISIIKTGSKKRFLCILIKTCFYKKKHVINIPLFYINFSKVHFWICLIFS